MRGHEKDYYPIADSAIKSVAKDIQQKVNSMKRAGNQVPASLVWAWIKDAVNWSELDRERIFKELEL